MNQNPYRNSAAPTSMPQANIPDSHLALVSQGKRFINYLVDRVLMTIGSICVGLVLGIMLAIVDPDSAVVDDSMLTAIGYIIGFIFVFLYFAIFESIFQKSPGKFLTGTKVVNELGNKPSFGQILGRSACRFIPFEAFSFLFGNSNRVVGWHDKFSGTRVVLST